MCTDGHGCNLQHARLTCGTLSIPRHFARALRSPAPNPAALALRLPRVRQRARRAARSAPCRRPLSPLEAWSSRIRPRCRSVTRQDAHAYAVAARCDGRSPGSRAPASKIERWSPVFVPSRPPEAAAAAAASAAPSTACVRCTRCTCPLAERDEGVRHSSAPSESTPQRGVEGVLPAGRPSGLRRDRARRAAPLIRVLETTVTPTHSPSLLQ